MINNQIIFVSRIEGNSDPSDWFTCYYYNIKGIDNSKIESKLIISDSDKIISIPISQIKWGLPITKNDYYIDEINLEKPIKKKPYLLSCGIKFHTSSVFFQRDLKCSNIMFCLSSDTSNGYTLVKYPVPIIKMLLFTCGYTQPASPVSCLVKDIFPIIFEFYEQIYPLFDNAYQKN